jgi:hypothetical protein
MSEEYIEVPIRVEPDWEYEDFETVSAAIAAADARGKIVYARVETKRLVGFIHFEIHPNGDLMAHAGEKTAKTMDNPVVTAV